MHITNIRFGLTKNLGNYESAKLEVEIIPESGKSVEESLNEVREYVEQQIGGATAPSKPKSTSPPLASKPADPTGGGVAASAAPSASPTTASVEKPPAKRGPGRPAKTTPAEKAAAVAEAVKGTTLATNMKRGRTESEKWATEHYKELQYCMDSQTVAELLERFNNLRLRYCLRFDEPNEWEGVIDYMRKAYAAIPKSEDDMDLMNAFVRANKSELNYIATGFRFDDDPVFCNVNRDLQDAA